MTATEMDALMIALFFPIGLGLGLVALIGAILSIVDKKINK